MKPRTLAILCLLLGAAFPPTMEIHMPSPVRLSPLIVFALAMSARAVEDLTPGAFDVTPAGIVVQACATALDGLAKAGAPGSGGGRVLTTAEIAEVANGLFDRLVALGSDLPIKRQPMDMRVALALDVAALALGWAATNAESNLLEGLSIALQQVLRDLAAHGKASTLDGAALAAVLAEATATLREVL